MKKNKKKEQGKTLRTFLLVGRIIYTFAFPVFLVTWISSFMGMFGDPTKEMPILLPITFIFSTLIVAWIWGSKYWGKLPNLLDTLIPLNNIKQNGGKN